MPIEDVIRLIDDQSGTKFDTAVVESFKEYVYKEYIPNQKKRAEIDKLKERQSQKTGAQARLEEEVFVAQHDHQISIPNR